MLLNYHSGRLVLSSLCVGATVRLVLGGVRFAGFSLQNVYWSLLTNYIELALCYALFIKYLHHDFSATN